MIHETDRIGNQYAWSDEERRLSMFEEVRTPWSSPTDMVLVELHAYELDSGVVFAWVWRNEWNTRYGQVGTTMFSGEYPTESRARQACRDFVNNRARRILEGTT